MTQHTQGEWKSKADAEANCFMILDAKGTGNWLAHIRFNGELLTIRQAEYARLIAAAPKLLQALEDILHDYDIGDYDDQDAIRFAKAAIATARGQ